VFVPMERSEMDMQHSHAVVAMMHHASRATVLKDEYTASQVLAFMSHLDLAVGMRLHFLILAAVAGVPIVALPYASKVAGFIEAMEMDMPPLKKVSAGQLIAHIDRAWDLREELRARMTRLLPALKAKARQTNELAVELLTRAERQQKTG
jgi:polysaccharide pyruvyl transferase WcaK-like protein